MCSPILSDESTRNDSMISKHNGRVDYTAQVSDLKATLKSLLVKHHGSTKNEDVIKIVEALSSLNPASSPDQQLLEQQTVTSSPLFLGNFCSLTCPNFPGRLKTAVGQEDIVQYTLGRLSFNMFQPKNLICTLRSTHNPVTKLPKKSAVAAACTNAINAAGDNNKDKSKEFFSYELITDITIHSEYGDYPAILVNEAICYQDPSQANRLHVTFQGTNLKPTDELLSDPSKLSVWQRTFEHVDEETKKEEHSFTGKIWQSMIQLAVGLTIPSSSDRALSEKHNFHFELKRAPAGYVDVLYLDEDIRITRGNRGTIVVAERC